ncbi:MAG TPA: MFS transporter [Sphingomonas sp.]|uniref:MFS transporter n=1 Tax=Sphingomonas sp. TaxID=28214 RepID=UPI002BDF99BE|nr:MFS transporter [Sphingomonas sp.]HMI19573.1 MFS transporter [Sphingomonas sp.]
MANDYVFRPEERPTFPGSPFAPALTLPRRLAYGAVGVLVGATASLGNGLVNVNVANLSGALGTYAVQATLLPAIYVAANASANLMLVKGRIQYGIPAITHGLLIAYACAGLLQLLFPGFGGAVLVRFISGMTAAGLTTLAIYYLILAFPLKLRPLALVVGIGTVQLGLPIARMIPIEMLALDHWRGLHLIEIGLALTVLAAISAVPLPPSECSRAFKPLDFLTYGLFLPAMLLLCSVLGLGRLLWWTDTPWLGAALAASVALFAAVALLEHLRSDPLFQLKWIGSYDIVRFAAVALVVRLALAEQTYGAVGLLTAGGLTNDQLHLLFAIVLVAMVLGIVTAALTISQERLRYQVMIASLIIALGAWLDTDATNVTRPPQLYLSQALIGYGTTLFVGPALVFGFLRMMQRGPNHLVSFIVLFNVTQNVGGLAGSALLGTYQVVATRAHAGALSEHLTSADPQVVARIQAGVASLSGALTDPAQQAAQGAALLGQALNREATVLAFGDVFRFVTAIALIPALYLAARLVADAIRNRRQEVRP